jgi:penicillin G amidase
MKKSKTIIILIVGLFLLIFIAGWGYKSYLLQRALPDYSGQFKLKGLHSKVEVYRDSFAIPHIFAQNEEDLYLVTGYLTAQDRLWQMDLLRRVTTGRLSEIFGDKLVNTDVLMRMLRIPEKSDKILVQSDRSVKKALEAYARGVNLYIEQHENDLPPEFAILGYKPEKWKPEHSLNLIGYIAWDLNGSWNSEIFLHQAANVLNDQQLNEFIPQTNLQKSVIFSHCTNSPEWRRELASTSQSIEKLGLQVFHGSNNWVVSGKRTSTGKPLLANDMHLGFSAPGVWYQIHQAIKDKLDVTGVLLPGQPLIVSGHNARIAWGLTNVMNDDIDFYRETINPADSNAYKLDGKWNNMLVKREAIAIKGKDTVYVNIRFTHRGPVISGLKNVKNEVISMRWVGNEKSDELKSIYYLNRAGNWDEFTKAMKTFFSVSQNVAYADVDGNIGMYCCAGIPIRKTGNPMDVFPGDTSASDWADFVPFEELPHVYNPKENFAISANNKTIDSSYSHYISYWFDLPYRYNRIHELIEKDSILSPADFASIQTDQVSDLVEQYLPELIEVLSRSNHLTETEKSILEALKVWKGEYTADSYCATTFDVFYNQFIENLVKDELGLELYQIFGTDKVIVRNVFHNTWIKRGSVLCDNIHTPNIETFQDIVIQSFRQTVDKLTAKFGTNFKKWNWSKIHSLTIEHPLGKVKILDKVFHLNRGPFSVGGSFHTVAPFTYRYNLLYTITSGASQRHIYNLANWDNSLSVIPTGISGIPSSNYYCDQTEMYINGKYHPDFITPALVRKKAKFYAVFEP